MAQFTGVNKINAISTRTHKDAKWRLSGCVNSSWWRLLTSRNLSRNIYTFNFFLCKCIIKILYVIALSQITIQHKLLYNSIIMISVDAQASMSIHQLQVSFNLFGNKVRPESLRQMAVDFACTHPV